MSEDPQSSRLSEVTAPLWTPAIADRFGRASIYAVVSRLVDVARACFA